jgi:hypothetical protein
MAYEEDMANEDDDCLHFASGLVCELAASMLASRSFLPLVERVKAVAEKDLGLRG